MIEDHFFLGRRAVLAVKAGCAALTFVITVSGCSGQTQLEQTSQEKLAPSMQTYARQLLEEKDPEWVVSQKQREVVEEVAETGRVSVGDYERSWNDYKQCMVDKGYKEIILEDYSNGMHAEAPHKTGTDAQEQQYGEDRHDCSMENVNYVNLLFGLQQGNPGLLANESEAIVSCLRREELVPASYTAEQFDKELSEGIYSFDEASAASRSCQIANGGQSVDSDTEVETLW